MNQAYFISPHLDDAIFSSGAKILQLQKAGYACTVITVFTEGGTWPQTLSARAFLKQTGFTNAKDLYAKRREEDLQLLGSVDVRAIHLGKVEALWRRSNSKLRQKIGLLLPEIAHVYPIYRLQILSGKIARADQSLVESVCHDLQRIIPEGALLFAPLGIGGHVDHVVVREACARLGRPLVYWADIPYTSRKGALMSSVDTQNLRKTEINEASLLQKKDRLCQEYKTQYSPVFGESGAVGIPEIFYE